MSSFPSFNQQQAAPPTNPLGTLAKGVVGVGALALGAKFGLPKLSGALNALKPLGSKIMGQTMGQNLGALKGAINSNTLGGHLNMAKTFAGQQINSVKKNVTDFTKVFTKQQSMNGIEKSDEEMARIIRRTGTIGTAVGIGMLGLGAYGGYKMLPHKDKKYKPSDGDTLAAGLVGIGPYAAYRGAQALINPKEANLFTSKMHPATKTLLDEGKNLEKAESKLANPQFADVQTSELNEYAIKPQREKTIKAQQDYEQVKPEVEAEADRTSRNRGTLAGIGALGLTGGLGMLALDARKAKNVEIAGVNRKEQLKSALGYGAGALGIAGGVGLADATYHKYKRKEASDEKAYGLTGDKARVEIDNSKKLLSNADEAGKKLKATEDATRAEAATKSIKSSKLKLGLGAGAVVAGGAYLASKFLKKAKPVVESAIKPASLSANKKLAIGAGAGLTAGVGVMALSNNKRGSIKQAILCKSKESSEKRIQDPKFEAALLRKGQLAAYSEGKFASDLTREELNTIYSKILAEGL